MTLEVSGKVEAAASVTLKCGAEYRWKAGNESRIKYCTTVNLNDSPSAATMA